MTSFRAETVPVIPVLFTATTSTLEACATASLSPPLKFIFAACHEISNQVPLAKNCIQTHLGARERSEIRSVRAPIVVRASRVRTPSDVLYPVDGYFGTVDASYISSILVL